MKVKLRSGAELEQARTEFNPAGVFLGISYGKDKALETLANWWGEG